MSKSTTCIVRDCRDPSIALGLCGKHYQQHRIAELRSSGRACIVANCGNPIRARNYCVTHYNRQRETGSVELATRFPKPERPCIVDGCDNPHLARGYCTTHYNRIRNYGTTELPRRPIRLCSVTDCDFKAYGRGYCVKHYGRWSRHGDPSIVKRRQPCGITGCERPCVARGFCSTHYDRVRKYGLTIEQFQTLLDASGGCCAICRATFGPREPYVDHDHDTKRVRGLLCKKCNTGIGFLDDDCERIRAALAYLEGRRWPM